MKNLVSIIYALIAIVGLHAQGNIQLALLKYNGGGDWYANPSSLPNLIAYCNEELNMNIDPEPVTVEVGSPDIFNYPFIHMTGHGNVIFSAQEKDNLSMYLKAGGFLHVDDNYGMDQYIRPQLNQLITGSSLVELPFNHDIYKTYFTFSNGVPKIH